MNYQGIFLAVLGGCYFGCMFESTLILFSGLTLAYIFYVDNKERGE